MFSGIVDRTAVIKRVNEQPQGRVLWVGTRYQDLALGESIAVNGVCLTVVNTDHDGVAEFFVSKETLELTDLRTLGEESVVNLERAVSLSTLLSGHLVQGHVDGVGKIIEITPVGESYGLRLWVPKTVAKYCVPKGSISVSGISLTLNSVKDQQDGSAVVDLMIIPHTWKRTRLSLVLVGDSVNLEADVIGKYVERLCHFQKQ